MDNIISNDNKEGIYQPDSQPEINNLYNLLKEILERNDKLYFKERRYLTIDNIEQDYDVAQKEYSDSLEESNKIKNKLKDVDFLMDDLIKSNDSTENQLLDEISKAKNDANEENEYMTDELRNNIINSMTKLEGDIKSLSTKYKLMMKENKSKLSDELENIKINEQEKREKLLRECKIETDKKMEEAKKERDDKLNKIKSETDLAINNERRIKNSQIEKEKEANKDIEEKLEIQYNELIEKLKKEKEVEVEKATQEYIDTYNKLLSDIENKKLDIEKIESDNKLYEKESRRLEIKIQDIKRFIEDEKVRRRDLACEIMDLKGNIRVFCRVRPILPVEIESGDDKDCLLYPVPGDIAVVKDESSCPDHYEFDCVFKPDSTQDEVFYEVYPYIQKLLDGFNICIFAYGQTGSGKTYTMEGPPHDPGVNTRSLACLFEIVESRRRQYRYSFTLSMLEIYNERIYDLLSDRSNVLDDISPDSDGEEADDLYRYLPKLKVRIDKDNNIYVDKLIEKNITSLNDAQHLLDKGKSNRFEASHAFNEHSSRSHLVVIIKIFGVHNDTGESFHGTLNLIDLAGSERVGKTEAVGKRLIEAKHINKSLSALGNAIKALGEGSEHVPYRDSKLTHILKDSLGGKSKVLMFTNVTPAHYNASETISSLLFGNRCRRTEIGIALKNYGQLPSNFKSNLIGRSSVGKQGVNSIVGSSSIVNTSSQGGRSSFVKGLGRNTISSKGSTKSPSDSKEIIGKSSAVKLSSKPNTSSESLTKPSSTDKTKTKSKFAKSNLSKKSK